MNKNTLVVEINCPIERVFQFTVNPANTSLWVKSVIEERASTQNIGVGTVYTQRVHSSDNNEDKVAFVITGFVENRQLDFHLVNGKYTCSYTYEPTPNGTRLTYSEESGVEGILESPMEMKTLEVLKVLLEQGQNNDE